MKLNCHCWIVKNKLFRQLAVLATFTMSTTLQANQYVFTQEVELAEKYPNVIQPFWEEQVTKGSFTGEEGVNIATAWVVHPQSKGTIVLSGGRTEAGIKYKEVFYDLYQNGFSVFTLDHRGQGLSGRMAENADKGHVEDYAYFVADLHKFVELTVLPNSKEKPNFLCHSMGCAIGALYLLSYPDTFEKAVFASPMFGINAPIPQWLANGIISTHTFFNTLFGDDPWYFLGQGDKTEEPFEGNVVSQSKVRYDISQKEFDDAGVALGGITTDWLKASLWAMQYIKASAGDIKTPSMLLQSGADTVVDNSSHEIVCNAMSSCILKSIKGAKHELMMEQDQYRNPAMNAIATFFSE